MPEPIRVRDDVTLHEYSTYAVDENGNSYEGLTVLDEPAVDANGVLLPPTYPEPDPAVTDATPTAKPTTAVTARSTEPTTGPKATLKES